MDENAVNAVAESNAVVELKRTALAFSQGCFVKIRSLSECLIRYKEHITDEQREKVILAINRLADGAHNLPQIVARFGSNDWASESTLSRELNIYREACTHCREVEAEVFHPNNKIV